MPGGGGGRRGNRGNRNTEPAPIPVPAYVPPAAVPMAPNMPTEQNPYAGLDPLASKTPIDQTLAKQYRDALQAGSDTRGLQQQLGMLDPLQHTAGYSNPAFASNRNPRPSTPQLPTGAPQGRVKPISKGMNYLQSIMPQGGGQPSSGGSTLMSQALRGGGTGQGVPI